MDQYKFENLSGNTVIQCLSLQCAKAVISVLKSIDPEINNPFSFENKSEWLYYDVYKSNTCIAWEGANMKWRPITYLSREDAKKQNFHIIPADVFLRANGYYDTFSMVLNDVEFVDMLQAYRIADINDQDNVIHHFSNIKKYLTILFDQKTETAIEELSQTIDMLSKDLVSLLMRDREADEVRLYPSLVQARDVLQKYKIN